MLGGIAVDIDLLQHAIPVAACSNDRVGHHMHPMPRAGHRHVERVDQERHVIRDHLDRGPQAAPSGLLATGVENAHPCPTRGALEQESGHLDQQSRPFVGSVLGTVDFGHQAKEAAQ
jgi:hypothetical protein